MVANESKGSAEIGDSVVFADKAGVRAACEATVTRVRKNRIFMRSTCSMKAAEKHRYAYEAAR